MSGAAFTVSRTFDEHQPRGRESFGLGESLLDAPRRKRGPQQDFTAFSALLCCVFSAGIATLVTFYAARGTHCNIATPTNQPVVRGGRAVLSFVAEEGATGAQILTSGFMTAKGISSTYFTNYGNNSYGPLPQNNLSKSDVAGAVAVVFMQTASISTCGPCLLVAYWAIELKVPLLPMDLAGGKYDFDGAKKLLLVSAGALTLLYTHV